MSSSMLIFFLNKQVNYLEFGKSWEQVTKERDYEDKPLEEEDLPTGFDSDQESSPENDWSDW